MSELILYVSGMSCRRCVREVTARLRDVPGVETVAADAGRSHVRLNGSMTMPDVIRAFAGTTYRPEVVENGVPPACPDAGPTAEPNAGPTAGPNRDRTEAGQRGS